MVCAGLLVWLCLSKKAVSRGQQLNAVLKNGQVGGLPIKDSLQLDSLLAKILKGAGITTPYTLNRAFDGGKKLRFFTCQPSAIAVTNCSKGNAVFDAELNVVFLDQSLVVPREWLIYDPDSGIQIRADELPFLRTYLEFIILHELGHFKLHHASAGFLDAGKFAHNVKWRKYEAQADSFAVSTMSRLIASDSSHTFFAPGTDGTIELKVDSTTSARSKTMTGLADVGQNMTFGMLFGLSPYSAFYQDEAHPTFIDRASGLINGALKEDPDQNAFTQRGEYTRNFLRRIAEVGKNNALVEVAVPVPLLNLNFDDKGVMIQTVDSGVFHAAYGTISPGSKGELREVRAVRLPFPKTHRYKFRVDRLFSFGDGRSYSVSNDDKAYVFTKKEGWLPTSFGKFDFAGFDRFAYQPQPADSVVVAGGYNRFYRMSGQQVKPFPAVADVARFASAALKLPGLSASFELIGREKVYYTLTRENRLAGLVTLDLQNLKMERAVVFNLQDNQLDLGRQAFDANQSRILVDEKEQQVYVVTAQLAPELSGKFGVFRLDSREHPELVVLKDFLYHQNKAKDQLKIKTALWNRCVAWLSPDTYAVNWDNDAVYHVDLEAGTAEPVFQPGWETLQLRAGTNGMLAIFSPGCYKFYIVQPGHTAGSYWPWLAGGGLLLIILIFTIIKMKK